MSPNYAPTNNLDNSYPDQILLIKIMQQCKNNDEINTCNVMISRLGKTNENRKSLILPQLLIPHPYCYHIICLNYSTMIGKESYFQKVSKRFRKLQNHKR